MVITKIMEEKMSSTTLIKYLQHKLYQRMSAGEFAIASKELNKKDKR